MRVQLPAPAMGTPRVQVLSVQPRYLPKPDRLEISLPSDHSWLVIEQAAGDATTSALLDTLTARGDGVIRISYGDPSLSAQVSGIETPIGGVIAVSASQVNETHNLEWVRELFSLAGMMQPILTETATNHRDARVTWLTVSRGDGALGTIGNPTFPVQIGGLSGLSKSLRLEWPDVFCRHVDMAVDLDPEVVSNAIVAELFDPNLVLTETAWNVKNRMTLDTTPWQNMDKVIEKPTPDENSVFLVSGGGRGITAQCVISLAERFHSKFILVGRSKLSDEPEPNWVIGVDDATTLKRAAASALREAGDKPNPRKVRSMLKPILAQREIRTTLEAVLAAGGHAIYVTADVMDLDCLKHVVNEAEGTMGSVSAILHGAGVLADKFIQAKTPDDFDLVVGVKVQGLHNLLACSDPGQLQQLVLFSSVAGFYGNMGQTDYSLANDILNKTAHQWAREHPRCRVLSMDWGPWDGGMVTPALKRVLSSRNIDVIPITDGTRILTEALSIPHPEAQYIIGNEMLPSAVLLGEELCTFRTYRSLNVVDNPFLLDHVIGGNAVLPTVCAVAWMVNSALEHYPGYHYFSVADYRVFKGVVFDEHNPSEYTLDVTEIHKVEGERVIADTLIWTQTETGKPRYHYRATITLVRQTPEAPRIEGFSLNEHDAVDGSVLYDGETLFHGPSFRGIQRVLNQEGNRLTLRCCLPDVSVDVQGQFPVHGFNPYLVDVQLQSLLVWSKAVYGYAGLPLSIEGGIQYRDVGFGETSFVTLDVRHHTPRSLVANVIIHDEHGLVHTQVTNAEITLSERLNTLFRQNSIADQEPVS